MIRRGEKLFLKPSEIVKYGLIVNTKGNADYRYVLNLIKSGELKSIQLNSPDSNPYYGVALDDIAKYNIRFWSDDMTVEELAKRHEEYIERFDEGAKNIADFK